MTKNNQFANLPAQEIMENETHRAVRYTETAMTVCNKKTNECSLVEFHSLKESSKFLDVLFNR